VTNRKLVRIGGALALLGLISGSASIFVPWQAQGVTVLNIRLGLWYVMLLLALFAVLGTAAMGVNQGRKFAGVAGPILSVVTAFIAVGLITAVDGHAGAGGWLGLLSLPPLGFACGLIAIGRTHRGASA
jgi:hypothetical protein